MKDKFRRTFIVFPTIWRFIYYLDIFRRRQFGKM
jgi:hypothetical protein